MFAAKFDILSLCFQKRKENGFTGVSWVTACEKYSTSLCANGKKYSCGHFSNQLEAAQAINLKCVELDLPLKNPQAGLPENKPQVRFIYVYSKI